MFVFFLLDLDLDLDLPSLKRTWTRTWTCSLKVDLDLDLDLRIVDLDFTVAGLVTSLVLSDLALYTTYLSTRKLHHSVVTFVLRIPPIRTLVHSRQSRRQISELDVSACLA